MKNVRLFTLVLTSSLIMYACKKEPPVTPPNNNPGNKTSAQLLSQKSWKISSLYSSSMDVWATSFVPTCNKDNEYKFRADDSLAQYDKSSKCSSNDPDSIVSFYKLYNNNKQIILNFKITSTTTLDDTADIVELSENLLKINTEYSGLPATISFTHP